MPTSNGLVGNEPVIVLKDTGCSRVIVKSAKRRAVNRQGWLCDDGRTHFFKSIFANVEVSTPDFSGTVEALCLKDLWYV